MFKGVLSPSEVKQMREVLLLTGASPQNVDAYIHGDRKVEEIMSA